MKIRLAVAFLVIGCAGLSNLYADEPLAKGSMNEFMTAGEAEWQLTDGVLSSVRSDKSGHIYTKAKYSNFELTAEVFIEADTNSGIYARCNDSAAITPRDCYEFNIWDANAVPANRTGAIVGLSAPSAEVTTVGKWSVVRMRLDADHLQFWVNSTLTSDIHDDQFKTGFVTFQYGGANGMVQFRNIKIESI